MASRRRRVIVAPAAARDLRRAQDWLLQPGSGPDARRRLAELRAASRALADHPHRGRTSAEYPSYREPVVSGWRLLYHVLPDTGDVEIVRAFGPGQRVMLH